MCKTPRFNTTTIFVTAMLLVLSTGCGTSQKQLAANNEGFDFTYGGSADDESWAGPKVGEIIDLERLKDRNGQTLSRASRPALFILVLVDPDCGAGGAASDQLSAVKNRVSKEGIPYYVASVTSAGSESDFFRYADSLNLGNAYLWKKSEPPPPAALFSMVLPSHLLVSRDGTIVRKWPGTSVSELNRARMANQIVSDTLQELRRSNTHQKS